MPISIIHSPMHLNITNNHLGNFDFRFLSYAGWNSFTVVSLVNQTMNANEAGSDPIVIQLPLCPPLHKNTGHSIVKIHLHKRSSGPGPDQFHLQPHCHL